MVHPTTYQAPSMLIPLSILSHVPWERIAQLCTSHNVPRVQHANLTGHPVLMDKMVQNSTTWYRIVQHGTSHCVTLSYIIVHHTVYQIPTMLIPADHSVLMYHGIGWYSMVQPTVYQTLSMLVRLSIIFSCRWQSMVRPTVYQAPSMLIHVPWDKCRMTQHTLYHTLQPRTQTLS